MERGIIEPQEASEIDVFVATNSSINRGEQNDSTRSASKFLHTAVNFFSSVALDLNYEFHWKFLCNKTYFLIGFLGGIQMLVWICF